MATFFENLSTQNISKSHRRHRAPSASAEGPISYGMFDETDYGALQGKNAWNSAAPYFCHCNLPVLVDTSIAMKNNKCVLVCADEKRWSFKHEIPSSFLAGSYRWFWCFRSREHSNMWVAKLAAHLLQHMF